MLLPKQLECNKNLTGLVANVLMDKYKRPTLILNQTEKDGEFWWEGSGRGYGIDDFKKVLENCGLSSFGGYAEGHKNAFGAGISRKTSEEFFQKVNEYLADVDFSLSYNVDFIWKDTDNLSENILEIALYDNIWGKEVEEPYIAIENIKITSDNIYLMSPDKNPTLKITLPNGVSCIKFKSSKEEYENLKPDTGCNIINLVGRCERNEWNGNINAQIIINDYEIVKSQKYYF